MSFSIGPPSYSYKAYTTKFPCGATALRIMTFRIMTLSITTFSITTLNMMALSILGLSLTLSITVSRAIMLVLLC